MWFRRVLSSLFGAEIAEAGVALLIILSFVLYFPLFFWAGWRFWLG